MKPTLSERLLRWLRRNPEWIHGEELTKLGQSVGYEGETVRRRLRELERRIEALERNKIVVIQNHTYPSYPVHQQCTCNITDGTGSCPMHGIKQPRVQYYYTTN